MRVYYRGVDALVTETQFISAANPAMPYAVADLRRVEIVQHRVRARVTDAVLAPAAVGVILIAPGWVVLHSLAAHVGLVLVVVAAVTLVISRRRSVGRWELRCLYRGREVTLYASTNATTFHQVSRALRRAVERANPIPDPRRALTV